MKEFHLQIATPDGIRFDGAAESLLVKCEAGDVEIMAGHADLFSSLGIGRARIKTTDGETMTPISPLKIPTPSNPFFSQTSS